MTEELKFQGEKQIVYLVAYSNYWPLEAESVWSTKELAQARVNDLSGDWRVRALEVDDLMKRRMVTYLARQRRGITKMVGGGAAGEQ